MYGQGGGTRPCDDCGGYDFVYDESTTDTVCRSCGTVAGCGTLVSGYSDLQRSEGGCNAESRIQGAGGDSRAIGDCLVKTARRIEGRAARRVPGLDSRDAKWIREAAARCALPHRVSATAVEIARALAERPFWVPKKNNNLMGVRVACLYHATVIEECPKDYKALADANGVPRRSVKNMISVTQCGHDDVARRVFRGCRHRSWPARIKAVGMVPAFLSSVPWMTDATRKRVSCSSKKEAETVGATLDNHCPKTVMASLVARAIMGSEALKLEAWREICDFREAKADLCPTEIARTIEAEIASCAGIAIATLRHTYPQAGGEPRVREKAAGEPRKEADETPIPS
jgi:hypothetical protein